MIKKLLKLLFLCILFIVGLSVIFTIPYFFPNLTPSLSASYDYGFNNKVGFAILFLFCSLLVFLSWKYERIDSCSTDCKLFVQTDDQALEKTFRVCMLFLFIFYIIFWFIARKTTGLWEAKYFIPRFHDLVIGRRLYIDIDFAYGPLLLYFPLFIYRSLSVFYDISIQDAYLFSVLALQCFALYGLYKILVHLDIKKRLRKIIFISLYIAIFPVSLGLNGIFRGVLPYIALYYLGGKERGKEKSTLLYAILLFIFTSVITTISPEIGMAFAFAIILSKIVRFSFIKKEVREIVYALVTLFATILWLFAIPGMFTQFKSFLSGGLNFPFVISFSLLFFFLSLFLLALNIGSQLRNLQGNIDILTLELLTCSMLPGALGRCDPGHLLNYGLFVFILVAFFLQRTKWNNIYIIGMILFVLLTLPNTALTFSREYGLAIINHPVFDEFFTSDSGKKLIYSAGRILNIDDTKISRQLSFKPNFDQLFSILDNISDIATPFDTGSTVENIIHMYLCDNNKYHHLPVKSVNIVGSKTAIDQNLQALVESKPKYLILPDTYKERTTSTSYLGELNLLFFTKYQRQQRYNGNELFRETISFIDNNYIFAKRLITLSTSIHYDLYQLK